MKRTSTVMLGAALISALGGCAALAPNVDGAGQESTGPTVSRPAQTDRSTPTSSGESAGANAQPAETAAESDEAEAVAAALATLLESLADSDPSPSRAAMVAALEDAAGASGSAGGRKAPVEVSVDKTPTGLEVDAIQGAVRAGGECVFGEVRDGKATVAILPPLSNGLCFIGDTR